MMNTLHKRNAGPSHTSIAICFFALGASALLSGCGIGPSGSTGKQAAAVPGLKLTGTVYGGQQPVSGSNIQLFTVNTSSVGGASNNILNAPVMTNGGGGFSITSDYGCGSATQVYITATGGNAGGGTNSAITLAAALGSCSALLTGGASISINIDEITTVAAAYALAPFATSITGVGAVGSNPPGLVGAFANAALLANTSTGAAGGAGLAAGVSVPTTELNTIADIISSCVNQSTAGYTGSACSTLFTATGASDTFGAALAMAKNPGASAITALYSLPPAAAPFQPSYGGPSAPNDFAVAVTITGNGTLATPFGIAIDGSGNAWVANETGTAISELSPAGALIASPTATGLAGAEGIAVDKSNNVWVANTAGNSVLEFTVASSYATASTFTAGITGPVSIALNSQGTAYIANYNGNSIAAYTSGGSALANSPFSGSSNITVPLGVAVDSSGNVYSTSGSGSIVKLTSAGAYTSSLNDGTLQGPSSVTVDTAGRLLATGFTTGTVVGGALSQFSAAGSAAAVSPITSGLSTPSSIASDGTSIWVTNGVSSGGLAQFAYGASSSTSPAAGYGVWTGANTTESSLNSPASVAIDNTGSVWTTNSGSNTVTKYIGIAAPAVVPLAANVGP